jgi:hypothetical protein
MKHMSKYLLIVANLAQDNMNCVNPLAVPNTIRQRTWRVLTDYFYDSFHPQFAFCFLEVLAVFIE